MEQPSSSDHNYTLHYDEWVLVSPDAQIIGGLDVFNFCLTVYKDSVAAGSQE
jgi:hypothetical protein